LKKTISIVLIILFLVNIITGSIILGKGNQLLKSFERTSLNSDETVWWNNTELSTEPYTAPFFKVYKLKHLGQAAYGLDVADFNNDGLTDIVVNWMTAPWDELAGISIFYRNDDHSFRVEDIQYFDLPTEDVEAADFDNDGDEDILFSQYEGDGTYSLNILWNDNEIFERKCFIDNFRKADDWHNPHFTPADFDNDGDVDFIIGANCGKVKLFKNDGSGVFTDEGVIFDYGDNSWGLDTGDFNDDGYPDFIVCARTVAGEYPFNDSGHIYLKLNDQSDTCFNTSDPGSCVVNIPFPFDYTIGAGVFGTVAVLDYNDDGLLDVLYAGDYKIFLIMQQQDGVFLPFYAVGLRGRELDWSDRLHEGGFTIGDFNDDGYDDVVAGGVQGDVRLLINNQTLVNVVKPEDRLLYFFGNDDYSLKFPGRKVIVGGIEVVAKGLEPLNRVDFYLNDDLVLSDETEPFTWNWTKFGFGKYTVAAEAYDGTGEFAGRDTFLVWKFL